MNTQRQQTGQRPQNQPAANRNEQEQARNVDRGSKRGGETANKQEHQGQVNDDRDRRHAPGH
ncbi:hypothetical protein SNE35_24030 [Paucibacter sp. R3-3]|uniref:Uncharacterized protein n=1 Tax=Roseateles agri TaxID=3098619 RepID=A0ABU5DMQ5_9BURK|nr:hypothetical protein [Paucibacter sp. R3-3]MDY0747593.1 hypothetical protein [Paucibacter sp. R3-3]